MSIKKNLQRDERKKKKNFKMLIIKSKYLNEVDLFNTNKII